jgi:hypothetical protein
MTSICGLAVTRHVESVNAIGLLALLHKCQIDGNSAPLFKVTEVPRSLSVDDIPEYANGFAEV